MLRKVLGAVLIILGLATAGLGVASATYWREPDSVVAHAVPRGDGTLVTTAPGVLELVGPDVTVVATVPDGGEVTVAVGRTLDVDGWVGIDHSTRIDGLSDWETLATTAVVPEIPEPEEGEDPAEPGTGADPTGNDMWLAEATGEGSATLRWADRPGRWSLLVAGIGEDAQAPTVELTWPRVPSTPWLWPGVGTGAALLVAGLLVLLVRRKGKSAVGGSASDGPADDGGVDTSGAPLGVVSPPAALTRRGGALGRGVPGSGTSGDDAGEAQPDARSGDAEETRPGTRPDDAATPPESEEAPVAPSSRRARRRAAQAAAAEETSDAAPVDTPGNQETEPEADPQSAPARRWPFSSPAGGAAAPTRRGLARRDPRAEPAAEEAAAPQSPASAPTPPSSPIPPTSPHRAPTGVESLQPGSPTPAEQAGADDVPPPTVTGSMPRITRRELREQEEARRAAAQTGLTGKIRALTGSIPAVRPAPAKPPAAGGDAPATRVSRSQAWRQAWGFDATDTDGTNSTGNDSEGGTR